MSKVRNGKTLSDKNEPCLFRKLIKSKFKIIEMDRHLELQLGVIRAILYNLKLSEIVLETIRRVEMLLSNHGRAVPDAEVDEEMFDAITGEHFLRQSIDVAKQFASISSQSRQSSFKDESLQLLDSIDVKGISDEQNMPRKPVPSLASGSDHSPFSTANKSDRQSDDTVSSD